MDLLEKQKKNSSKQCTKNLEIQWDIEKKKTEYHNKKLIFF